MWLYLVTIVFSSTIRCIFSELGPCSKPEVQSDCVFDEIYRINNGVISYRSVPDVDLYKDLNWLMLYSFNITYNGLFRSAIIGQSGNDAPMLWSSQYRWDQRGGLSFGQQLDAYNLIHYCLAYEPGQFAFILVCSENGNDQSTDYRYVLSNTQLTREAKRRINQIEEQNNFKGKMRYLYQEDVEDEEYEHNLERPEERGGHESAEFFRDDIHGYNYGYNKYQTIANQQ